MPTTSPPSLPARSSGNEARGEESDLSGLDPVDAYTRASATFGEVVAGLGDDEWEVDTWPEGWNAITTTAWVVVGDSQIPLAVAGEPLQPPRDFDAGVLGPNPVATWRGTALAALAALRTPGALDRTAALPAGEIVVADLVGQRVTENLVRAHDIAVAIGRHDGFADEVGADLVDWCLEFWIAHADVVLRGEVMAADPVEPPPGSDLWIRLLALTGRRH